MSFEVFDDKVSGATSAVYIGRSAFVIHDIEKPEAFDLARSLVPFPLPTFEQVGFHHLAVVTSQELEVTFRVYRSCSRMSADAAGVDCVGFLQTVLYAYVLGDIAVGHSYVLVGMRRFEAVVHGPSHDGHEGRITEGL